MKNILHIMSSPMGNDSHSIKLGKTIVQQLLLTHPGSSITERNLVNDDLPYLDGLQISALFKSDAERNEAETNKLSYSDVVLSELKQAHIIVIGAPMYNFGIHASLKAFIDQVVRFGHTIACQADGSKVGLLTNKTVYLAVTAGGSYENNACNPVQNYIVGYLSTILRYIGISHMIPCIMEGTARPGFIADYKSVVAGCR